MSDSAMADPYQKLDQPLSSPALLHASPGRVAVGVEDPGLGWLEVTTRPAPEGQVAAAILTGSSHTQAAITAQLPSLSHYLAENAVRVSHVDVTQQSAGQGSSGGLNASAQNEGQQGQQPGSASGQQLEALRTQSAGGVSGGYGSFASAEDDEDGGLVPLRYISVHA